MKSTSILKHNLMRATLMLALIVTCATAWAQITINSADDWNTFATNVSNGTSSYSGQTVTLAADISVSTMAGSSQANSFKGTFDGGGHTLTFNYTATEQYAAPFRYIDGATIKNLHVDGTIQTSAKYAAGIAAQEYGTTTIKNCRSSIIVVSSVDNNGDHDGTHGGFVAVNNNSTLTIEGCVFDGKLLTTNGTNNCGGFVGWKGGTLNITNSIYNPAEIANNETEVLEGNDQYRSKTFARMDANTITNCFYTRILGSAQGKQPHSITTGNNVTIENIALTGNPTTYSVSGITAYSNGLNYGNTLYYGNGDNVSLTLNTTLQGSYVYYVDGGTLSSNGDNYTLTMPDADVTISALSSINEISSVDDWNAFCALVNSGHNYSGETVTLTADITTATTKAGTSETTPFKGTFDGQGHTLTVNIASSNDQGNAPFQNIEGATIKNLTVEGTVTANNYHAGGLVGFVRGTGTNTFQNCLVKTTVNSSSTYAGGIIGHGLSSNIVMEGCAYTGEIKATGTNYVGGLIGWSDDLAGLTITDCLFAGTYTNSSNSKKFHPIGCTGNANNISNRTITNTYYTLDNINLNNDSHALVYNLANQGKHGYTISGGTGVTVANAGTETTYGGNNVTHFVTGYGTGIKCNDVLYAGNQDNVSLTISGNLPENYEYSASAGILNVSGNSYTLIMPSSNVTISILPLAIYEIDSQDDWMAFCTSVNGGNNYSGKTVTLTGNVTVGSEDNPVSGSNYMAGTSDHRFKGTFNGQGNTLTFYYTASTNDAAPFGYLEGATIQNLHVNGTIQTSAKFAAGIAAHTYGTTSITNCQSSIVVISSVSGDGTHGGFVGVDESGTLNITGCLFNGKLLTTNGTDRCGGFVGWHSSGTLNISNSLYMPADLGSETWIGNNQSATFARNDANITNCYYTTSFDDGTHFTGQGKHPRSITASNNATIEAIALIGDATDTYSVSGITAYSNGLNYGNTLYYGSGDNVSLTLSTTLPEPYYYNATGGILNGNSNPYTLKMPNADVIISAQDTPVILDISYIGEDGQEHILNEGQYTVLEGGGSISLNNGGWYVVKYDILYTGTITLGGEAKIILVDGCTMNIGTSSARINGNGIRAYGTLDLKIYGQTLGTGALNIYTTGRFNHGIWSSSLTINGGTVTADADGNSIYALGASKTNLTINGGTVTARANGNNASAIIAYQNLTINGGTVTASATGYIPYAINASNGNITLGWTNPTDHIYANSYHAGGTLTLTKTFIDTDGNTYSGTIQQTNGAYSINGKTLQPSIDWATSNTGTADDPYMIYTKQQLDMLAYRVNGTHGETLRPDGFVGKYFKLGADIEYTYTTEWDDDTSAENNYEAIGGVDDNHQYNFKGNFDGNGHTISGIRIYKPNANNQGLFGHTDGANIHDLTLADARITGSWQTGGIVGFNQWSSTITRCHVAANVTIRVGNNDADCFGGIAGYNYTTCTIDHCTSSVKISNPFGPDDNCQDFGAITGWNQNSILSDNLAIGASVPASYSSHNYHGAICGYNSGVSEQTKLERNYYVACTVAGVENATGVGCGDNDSTFDITDNDGAVPGNARVVDGYDPENTGNNDRSKWVFIASPVNDNGGIAPNNVTNLVANTAADYDLYRFNQAATLEWENYKFHNNDAENPFNALVNGQGYLYANKANVTLKFIGTTYNTGTEPVEVPLIYNGGKDFAGWNLVGNPFPRAAYANKSYYVIDDSGSVVDPVPVSNATYISPCTGVMVKADDAGESVIFSTSPQTQSQNNGMLQVALSQVVEPVETPARDGNGPSTLRQAQGPTLLDKAIVSFNEGDELAKFVFNIGNAKLYIPQGAEEYAIAYSNGQGEMPVNFKAYENGTYTIAVNPENVEMSYLHLIDNMTGADVDLLPLSKGGRGDSNTQASYTFNAKTTDYESRFKLVFVANGEDGSSTGSETFAFISNGNIIVSGEGTLQVVDVMGRVVVSRGGRIQCVPTTGMTPGVYVLRLINGEDVRVQKIVIQ